VASVAGLWKKRATRGVVVTGHSSSKWVAYNLILFLRKSIQDGYDVLSTTTFRLTDNFLLCTYRVCVPETVSDNNARHWMIGCTYGIYYVQKMALVALNVASMAL
jgi:hypothetical protein